MYIDSSDDLYTRINLIKKDKFAVFKAQIKRSYKNFKLIEVFQHEPKEMLHYLIYEMKKAVKKILQEREKNEKNRQEYFKNLQ